MLENEHRIVSLHVSLYRKLFFSCHICFSEFTIQTMIGMILEKLGTVVQLSGSVSYGAAVVKVCASSFMMAGI